MTPDGRVARAKVLSGGSAYAAYEVGVRKALLRGEPGEPHVDGGYQPSGTVPRTTKGANSTNGGTHA
jgi:hypothetical protein